MDKDAPGTSIQDQYLTRARKNRWWLTVFLNSGKKIGGRVVGFDRYVVVLEDRGQEQMVFKHAIATMTTSRSFSNTIDVDRARPSRERDVRGPAATGETRSRDGAPAGEDTGMRGEETGGRTPSGSAGAPPGSPGVE